MIGTSVFKELRKESFTIFVKLKMNLDQIPKKKLDKSHFQKSTIKKESISCLIRLFQGFFQILH